MLYATGLPPELIALKLSNLHIDDGYLPRVGKGSKERTFRSAEDAVEWVQLSRNGRYLFTSESVTEGHPDKIADQISDSDPRRHPRAGPGRPRRLRDARHHRPRDHRRRDHHELLRRLPEDRPRHDQGRRLHRAKYGFDSETCAVLSSITSSRPTSRWASTRAAPATRA